MNRTKLPTRFTPQEIELNRDKLRAYAVLPVPEHAIIPLQFETIGRTTFKKYIIKSYEALFSQRKFPVSDFWNVPYIISTVPTTVPHVINIEQQPPAKSQQQQTPKPQTSQPDFQGKVFPQPQPKSAQINPPMDFSLDNGSKYYAPSHRKMHILF